MFGKPKLIDKASAAWIFDRFGWVIETFSIEKSVQETELVLPTADHFPPSDEGRELSHHLFRIVQTFCGVEDWKFELQEVTINEPKPVGPGMLLQPLTQAELDDPNAESPYIPIEFVASQRAEVMIWSYSHQIAWKLMQSSDWPDEFQADEAHLIADLITIYLGFGIFSANCAFESAAFHSALEFGWSSQQHGSLPEDSRLFALAIFMAIAGSSPAIALPHLKARLRKRFNKACRQVACHEEDVRALRALGRPKLSLV